MTEQKKRIALYIRDAVRIRGTGVTEYIFSIVDSIYHIYDKDIVELYVVHNGESGFFEKRGMPHINELVMPSRNRIICDFYYAPLLMNREKIDAVWYPKNVIPFFLKAKKLLTILDLGYFRPEFNAYTKKDTVYMKNMIRSSVKRADHIVAISEFTKDELADIVRVPHESISVVHEAIDPERFTIPSINNDTQSTAIVQLQKKYNLDKPYILFTGGITPRKNLIRLMRAFEKAQNKIPHDLVLTGNIGWNNEIEMSIISKNSRIKHIGFVDEEEIPLLYSVADMYMYVTLYEGFPRPILEAQALHCPVIASSIPPNKEGAGDSVIYIDGYSEDQIKNAIIEVATNEFLKRELIEKGTENILRFSLKKQGEKMYNLLMNL